MHQALRGFEFGERKHHTPQEAPSMKHDGPSSETIAPNDGPICQAHLFNTRLAGLACPRPLLSGARFRQATGSVRQ
jgi:hypothetical protein